MVLYICVGPGGYLGYLKYGYYDHMPNAYVSHLHLYSSLLWAGACFYWYYRAVNTDPGIITQDNVKHYLKKYEFDGVMFQRDNAQKVDFGLTRPARSKHSAITNNCVSKFDHYCIWIKGDVGFIGGHAVLTLYGVWFGLNVLNGIVTGERLWGAQFKSMDTGEIFTAGYGTIFQYLLHKYPIFVFLVILCTVMCISLSLFFLYHMYLVYLGFTTNEKIKKSCIEDDIDYQIKQRMIAIGRIKDIDNELDKQQYIELKEDIAELKEKLQIVKNLSYSKGFLRNLREIIRA